MTTLIEAVSSHSIRLADHKVVAFGIANSAIAVSIEPKKR